MSISKENYTFENLKELQGLAGNFTEFLSLVGSCAIEQEDSGVDYTGDPLWRLSKEVLDLYNQLKKATEWMKNRATRILETLNNDQQYISAGVNSLGEFQANSIQHDILCALYAKAHHQLMDEINNRKAECEQRKLEQRMNKLDHHQHQIVMALKTYGYQSPKEIHFRINKSKGSFPSVVEVKAILESLAVQENPLVQRLNPGETKYYEFVK